jgi:hypothetical protein
MDRLIQLSAYLDEVIELGRGKQIAKFAKMAKRKGLDADGVRVVGKMKFPKKAGWKAKHIKQYRKMTKKSNPRGEYANYKDFNRRSPMGRKANNKAIKIQQKRFMDAS